MRDMLTCTHWFALAVADKYLGEPRLESDQHKFDSVVGLMMYDVMLSVIGVYTEWIAYIQVQQPILEGAELIGPDDCLKRNYMNVMFVVGDKKIIRESYSRGINVGIFKFRACHIVQFISVAVTWKAQHGAWQKRVN